MSNLSSDNSSNAASANPCNATSVSSRPTISSRKRPVDYSHEMKDLISIQKESELKKIRNLDLQHKIMSLLLNRLEQDPATAIAAGNIIFDMN